MANIFQALEPGQLLHTAALLQRKTTHKENESSIHTLLRVSKAQGAPQMSLDLVQLAQKSQAASLC